MKMNWLLINRLQNMHLYVPFFDYSMMCCRFPSKMEYSTQIFW